jgi:hypothetical protein
MVNPGWSERKRERAISLFNEMMTSARGYECERAVVVRTCAQTFPALVPDRSRCGAIGADQVVAAGREKRAMPPVQARH